MLERSTGRDGGRVRDRLLCSASAFAIAMGLTAGGEAARAEEAQLILEIDGGWVFGPEQPWARQLPSGEILRVGPGEIYSGTVGLITPIPASPWNAGMFARFARTGAESQSRYDPLLYNVIGGYRPTYYTSGSVEHQEEHVIVDFEARRDVGLGSALGTKSIFSAGLRFGYFSAATDTRFLYPGGYILDEERDDIFVGFGPHVGIDTSTPLAGGFALDLSASASVLIGPRVTSAFAVGEAPFVTGGSSDLAFVTVPMLEGRVGFSYTPSSQLYRISLGVEASAWFGIFDQRTTIDICCDPPGDDNADRFLLRPYARLTVPLGGAFGTQTAVSTSDYFDAPVPVSARMAMVVEAEAGIGQMWRDGDALNQTGNPADEVEDFGLVGGKLLAAVALSENLLVQGEVHGETGFGNETSDGAPSNDSYDRSHLFGGQIGLGFGPLTFTAFGGVGGTEILNRPGQISHDSTNALFGASGRYLNEFGSLAVQIGAIDTQATDPEVIDEALFARVIGQMFLNGGRTMVQGDFALATGEQDADFIGGPNTVDIAAWGAEIEHQLPLDLAGNSASVFLAYRGVSVSERSFAGTEDDLVDHGVYGGVRLRLGAMTPFAREAGTAPDLPNIGYWIGAVPAVD